MNLKPGPELDALVAEHVLKQIPCDGWIPGPFMQLMMQKCDHPVGTCNPIGCLWGYSSVPGWAVKVREWIIKKITPYGGNLSLVWVPTDWHGQIRIGMMVLTMHGETPEHLYSLLALRLVGAPVDFGGLEEGGNPGPEELTRILGPEFNK